MQIEKYLKDYQPVIYQTFVNSLAKKKLSHAYLIVGNPGTPLLETATYLAKSILCDHPDPLACNTCITCLRIEEGNYSDFILLDGSKGTIKKEEINALEAQFEKKAFEAKGIMIYVLHQIENMTVEAVNAILKFLEEPDCEVYAFLTTQNENAILPTIVSRCQTLHLKQIDRRIVINKCTEMGVLKEDAELLSYFYNDPEMIAEFIENKKENSDYFDVKTALGEYLQSIIESDSKNATFIFQSQVLPLVKQKEESRMFLDLLICFYEDLIRKQNQDSVFLTSYDTMLDGLCNKLSHLNETLVTLLKARSLISLNVNLSLLLNHVNFMILKEDEPCQKM